MDVKYLIGIDIGHGESAVSCCEKENGKLMRLKLAEDANLGRVYSAFCQKDGNGDIILITNGERIKVASHNSSLRLGFKHRIKAMSDDDKTSMALFVKALYDAILYYNDFLKIDGDNRNFEIFIACPTEWSKEDAEEYLDFICLAGVPVRWITSEASAAYVKFRKTIPNNKKVIIIDWGSSTIDYSAIITGVRILIKSSIKLGACAVEDSLVNSKKMQKELSDIAHQYEESVLSPRGLLLWARFAKEKYFSLFGPLEIPLFKELLMPVPMEFKSVAVTWKNNDELLTIEQYAAYKDKVKIFFRNLLNTLANKAAFQTDIIVLSGSASKMDFVKPLLKDVFGDEVQIITDPQSEFVVSDGIAYMADLWYKDKFQYNNLIVAERDIYRALANECKKGEIYKFVDFLETLNMPEAKYTRALCYYFGVGYNKSAKKAFELFNDGTPLGKAVCAYLYFRGQGVKKDVDKAKELIDGAQEVSTLKSILFDTATEQMYDAVYSDLFILSLFRFKKGDVLLGTVDLFDYLFKVDSRRILSENESAEFTRFIFDKIGRGILKFLESFSK